MYSLVVISRMDRIVAIPRWILSEPTIVVYDVYARKLFLNYENTGNVKLYTY